MRFRVLGLLAAALCSVPAYPQALVGDVNRDGVVDENDINLITGGIGSRAIGSADPRDLNADGRINLRDVRLAILRCDSPKCAITPAVKMTQTASKVTITEGLPEFVTTFFNYSSPDEAPRTITVTQTLTPAGSGAAGGVIIAPAPASTYTVTRQTSIPLNQRLTAKTPGTYTLTTTARLDNATVQRSTVTVTITPRPTQQALLQMAISPGAVPIHTGADIILTTKAVGFDPDNPPAVTLKGLNFPLEAQMMDDGKAPDATAGDGVYSAAVHMDAPPGNCLIVQASAGKVMSPESKLCATNLPCFPVPATAKRTFTDAAGNRVIPDEMLISFNPGSTEDDINALAAAIPADVVGGMPELQTYQFRLRKSPISLSALESAMAVVRTFPIVATAEPHSLVSPQRAYVPNNALYSTQDWARQMRFDEAWWWTRGGPNIAVLDTGVTSDSINVRTGYNSFDGTTKTADYLSGGEFHGTAVAGLAAGYMNTGAGITGAAPASPVIPVAMYDPTPGAATGSAPLISGINWAAANGASVINISATSAYSTTLCSAVSNAVKAGIPIVSAAGNDAGVNACRYGPAGCAGNITVGATDGADTLATYSNAGACVRALAPGAPGYSTKPPSTGASFGAIGSGTSFSTPLIAGAIALMKGYSRPARDINDSFTRSNPYSAFTTDQIVARLQKTAVPVNTNVGGQQLSVAGGRVDVAEAIFNLSFEDSDLTPWITAGTATAVTNVQSTCPGGPLCPQDRSQMGYLSIGGTGDGTSASFTQLYVPQANTSTTPVDVTFKYAFVTTRPPSARPSAVNETFTAAGQTPTGRLPINTVLATENVNAATLTPLTGITLAGGTGTVYWTGWKTATGSFSVPNFQSGLNFSLSASGATGGYQTIVLIDAVQFK